MEKNVLSLFDGMSCGQIALNRAGIKIDKYFASEVDKHAIKVTMANYPNTIQLGSVTDVDGTKLPPIFLLHGGSPCQSFSMAGKRKGMATKDEQEILTLEHYLKLKNEGYEFEGQSYLFWEYVRLLKEVKPKYFLLENVLMAEKWEKVITKTLGVAPIMINSALVSAQHRKRLYWTNIGMEPDGLFGDLKSIIPQPKDKGILLKDILEDEVDEKYYLSQKMLDYFKKHNERHEAKGTGFMFQPTEGDKKANCLRANGALNATDNTVIKLNTALKPSANQDKSGCLTGGGHSGGAHSDMDLLYDPICLAMRGRNPDNPKSIVSGLHTEQMLEPRSDGKTNCLTTVQKDNLVYWGAIKFGRTEEAKAIRKENMKSGKDHTPFADKEIKEIDENKMNTLTTSPGKYNLVMQVNPSLESGGEQPYQQNRIYDINGITPALCANKSDLIILRGKPTGVDYRSDEGFRFRTNGKSNTLMARAREDVYGTGLTTQHGTIRRLTPEECEALQTVPRGYTSHVSNSQRYKMLGNGWTVDVIAHIYKFIK